MDFVECVFLGRSSFNGKKDPGKTFYVISLGVSNRDSDGYRCATCWVDKRYYDMFSGLSPLDHINCKVVTANKVDYLLDVE